MKPITYPTKYELTEALGMCRRKFVDTFAQRRGVFVYGATLSYLAEQLSKLFLDEEDFESIREHAHRNKTKKVTVGFVIAAPNEEFDPKEIIEGLRNAPSRPGDSLSAVRQVSETFQSGSLDYEVNKPGRIDLLQHETRHVNYSIEAGNGNTFQVFVEAHSSSDARYFEAMYKGALKDKASVNVIDFAMLSAADTIQFFDDLSEVGLGSEWKKTRVNELTLRRSSAPKANNGDEEDDEHKEASEEVLSVINRAILEGKDLRDNALVTQLEKDGHRFSAMTIEFAEKEQAHVVEMRAEFKLRPDVFEIKIASNKKLVLVGNIETHEPDYLTGEEERELITRFWYAAKHIYDNLVTARANGQEEAKQEALPA